MTRFDVDPPIRPEPSGGGWDFKWDPLPPTTPTPRRPGGFEGMLDGYEEEVVPPLGITDEELGRVPGPLRDPQELGPVPPGRVCRVEGEGEPSPSTGGGGGRIAPGMEEALEAADEQERRREVIENPMDHLFIDMF